MMVKERPRKKIAILSAATELFLEHGFQNVSIRTITEKAACSRETVYRYYRNKEDIFADAIASQMEAYLAAMNAAPTGASEDLRGALITWSVSLISSVADHDYIRLRRLIIGEMPSRPEHGKLYYDLTYQQGIQAVTVFFRHGQRDGRLKAINPARLAKYFVGMLLYELVHQRVLGVIEAPGKQTAKRWATQVVDDFLLVYGA